MYEAENRTLEPVLRPTSIAVIGASRQPGVSQLMGDHPEIAEMDINPFLVQEEGGVALDARLRVSGGTEDTG